MFTYKQFFSSLLTEMYYGKTHKDTDLPDNRPYGFMVYPDGTFGIAHSMMSHDDLVGGRSNMNKIVFLGGVRLAIGADNSNEHYFAEYIKARVKPQALRTAKDLASWYGLPLKFEEYDANRFG